MGEFFGEIVILNKFKKSGKRFQLKSVNFLFQLNAGNWFISRNKKILINANLHMYFYFIAGKPSRVIHIRNIPNESSEAEVIQLGVPFGRVTNVLVLKGKNQAFLEMADEVSAAAMVACFNSTPPQVRGRTVYIQFSNHRELKTDQSHSIAVSYYNILLLIEEQILVFNFIIF